MSDIDVDIVLPCSLFQLIIFKMPVGCLEYLLSMELFLHIGELVSSVGAHWVANNWVLSLIPAQGRNTVPSEGVS